MAVRIEHRKVNGATNNASRTEPEQNRDTLNALHDQCAQEKLQIIGHIQSHGMLFVLSAPDHFVRQVSANVSDLLGIRADEILGRPFAQVIGTEQLAALRFSTKGDEAFFAMAVSFSMRDGPCELSCVAHRQSGMLIIEVELVSANPFKPKPDIDTQVRLPLLHLERAKDIEELSQVAAEEIHQLSGFDRVMIYRFDEHWNGEVISEVSTSSAVSYRGLRFPATDIPPQARQLFVVNPLRAIADVDSPAVPIIPGLNPLTGKPLDLTQSLLRSASPIHLEYLRNMDVKSSMTVSIIVGGKLWGMIACHHPRPHSVDRSTRSIAVLIGQNYASQVTLRVDNAALQTRVASRECLERYVTEIESRNAVFGTDLHEPRILECFDADGLISSITGVVACSGVAVESDAPPQLIARLGSLATRGVASSHSLSALVPATLGTCQAGGALYIELGETTGDYLLLLRRELPETVIWAGNPHEAVSVDAQNQLHPRASFAAWGETVRGLSRAWTTIALENARYLREQLLRLRDTQQLAIANRALVYEIAERERVEADLLMAQKLESVGRLAAGVAHEINTPVQFVSDNVQFVGVSMTAIVGVIEAYRMLQLAVQSGDHVAAAAQAAAEAEIAADLDYILDDAPRAIESASDGLKRIATIVRSMKELAHPDQTYKTFSDLNRAIENTLLVAASEYKNVADVQTDFGELPPVLCYLGEINQVVLNLLINAACAVSDVVKDTGQRGTITVRTRLVEDEVEIAISDTGTGIPRGVRQRIFDPFFTTKEVGKGTGQGLAIAQSVVVRKHGGSLRFETECGKGTTFFVRLPVGAPIQELDVSANAA